jgi:hypothetical protein
MGTTGKAERKKKDLSYTVRVSEISVMILLERDPFMTIGRGNDSSGW